MVEPGPTQYPNAPPESDPPTYLLSSVLFKYLINKTTVDNGYSQGNKNLTNCNTKIFTKANFVLFATTKLNTFGGYVL